MIRRKHKKGFTLVEMLAGMVILAVCIIPISALFFMNLILLDKAWDLTSAMAQAETVMEDIRNLPYSQIINENGKVVNFLRPFGSGIVTVDNSNPDLLKVTLKVQYKDSRTDQYVGTLGGYPVTLQTYIAKRY